MTTRAALESIRARELVRAHKAGISTDLHKSDLVEYGRVAWEFTYKHTKDDAEIGDLISDYLDDIEDPERRYLIAESFKLPDQNILTFGTARWCDGGFPVVRMGHKRAAALMATNVSRDILEHVLPPFPAFYIEVPNGLLSTTDVDGTSVDIVGVLVHRMNLKNSGYLGEVGWRVEEDLWRWRWAAITNTRLLLWQLNRNIEELVGHDVRENQLEGFGFPIDDRDERVSFLIGRLIVSTCLVMSNPEGIKVKKEPLMRGAKKAKKGSPTQTVHSFEVPIEVDARPALASYLRGERTSPSIRQLVRGHFKPNLGARLGRIVWIHPYARGGAEGDPIMQRVYKVGEPRAEGDDGNG